MGEGDAEVDLQTFKILVYKKSQMLGDFEGDFSWMGDGTLV